MAEITLRPKELPTVPLEVEISPDKVAGKSIDDVKKFPILKGNREKELGEYFEVTGTTAENAADIKIIIDGNVDSVKYIGKEMTAGEILIKGSTGMHTGDDMKGGKITIEGDCADFCAFDRRSEQSLVDVFVAKSVQEVGSHQRLHGRERGEGKRTARDFADGQAIRCEVQVCAAQRLRIAQAEETELSQLVEQLPGEFAGAVDGGRPGSDALVGEPRECITNESLLW